MAKVKVRRNYGYLIPPLKITSDTVNQFFAEHPDRSYASLNDLAIWLSPIYERIGLDAPKLPDGDKFVF